LIGTSWETRGVLLIQASFYVKTRDIELSAEEESNIRNLSDKRLGIVGNLYCVIGSRYIVGKNESVANGIANGTLATLQNVVLQEKAKIRRVRLENGNEVHMVSAADVACLVFRHEIIGWSNSSVFQSLPVGCFPIVPISATKEFRVGPERNKACSVRISQFPCVSALVLTGHKIQGQTLDSILIGNITDRHKYGSTGWVYVALSRVRSSQGLYTLVELPRDPKKYKLRKHVVAEMNRLRKIEERTLQRLQHVLPVLISQVRSK
jgi:hypothetical protein